MECDAHPSFVTLGRRDGGSQRGYSGVCVRRASLSIGTRQSGRCQQMETHEQPGTRPTSIGCGRRWDSDVQTNNRRRGPGRLNRSAFDARVSTEGECGVPSKHGKRAEGKERTRRKGRRHRVRGQTVGRET